MKALQNRLRHQRRGFTLVELMVAMGITAVIFTVLISITSSATDAYSRSRSEVKSARQAKAAVDVLARDLASYVSRSGNTFEWLHASIEQVGNYPSEVVKGQGSSDRATSLTFLTATTDRYFGQLAQDSNFNNGGDISGVGYRLRFQDPITGDKGQSADSPTFVLYRLLVNPDDAFTDLLGKTFDEENPASTGLTQGFSDGGHEAETEEPENFVCENIHQFTLTFHVEVSEPGVGVVTKFVSLDPTSTSSYFSVTGGGIKANGIRVGGQTLTSDEMDQIKTGQLTAVEISLSVLSDSGVARLIARDGLSEKDYARNSFHYSRIVELPQL